jgi:hypothetical protein
MMRAVIMLFAVIPLAVSISADVFAQEPMSCIPPEEGMAGLDVAVGLSGAVLTGINFALIAFNSERLKAERPSGGGATAGILCGFLGAAYGTAITFSDENLVRVAGVGCLTAGAVSFFYGVRSSSAHNRIHDEKNGLKVEPVFIRDRKGRYGPGFQVSWSF